MKLKPLIVALAVSFAAAMLAAPTTPVHADGNCPSQKNGKCPQANKVTHKRSQYTEAQRAKLMEEARAICTKKFGASSRVHHLDYYNWKVWCTEPGY